MRVLIAALVGAVFLACGSGGSTPAGTPIAFTDEGASQQSGYSGDTPKIEVTGSSPWRITAYQGQQRTLGYAIRVERVTSTGTVLRLTARFSAPPPGAVAAQALSSPAHRIAIPFLPDAIVLYDQDGIERARWSRS